jgi:two-component system phosphate regulon sensor histidine kinase PhoR
VGLILVAFVVADLYLARSLDTQLTERVHQDALARLALIEREASRDTVALTDVVAWDALADDLGARGHGRVTIIRLDGVVIGDSDVDTAALASLGNHADRPEVIEALARGSGSSERMSETVHERLAYVAAPFRHEGEIAGTVRFATRLAVVEAAVDRLHGVLFAATAGSLFIAVVMSSLASHWMAKVVRMLTVVARKMAGGDLEVRTGVAGEDEVAELGRALDQLASGLSDAITQLRGERDLLGGVLDGMEEGVLVLDERGRIVRVNPALRAMLLLDSDVIGRPLIEVVRNADLKELVDRARIDAVSREIRVSGLKPRRLLVRAAVLSQSDAARADEALLVVFRDITAMRRLETMRRDFVANASHELRTPVTAVRSAAETLRDGASSDPEAMGRFVDIIARNSERLQRLIEDLLDLSRIEAKEFRLSREAVSLRPFLDHTTSLLRGRAEDRRVRLATSVPDDVPSVYADRRALEQVTANLIDNAIKYCPGASVTVSAELRKNRVALLVADTGPGIEAKHLPRIFERFYRVDPGRSRELGGTGLGLSIVKHLVEAMGGNVSVASEVGKGTTFTILLPRARSESTATVAQI